MCHTSRAWIADAPVASDEYIGWVVKGAEAPRGSQLSYGLNGGGGESRTRASEVCGVTIEWHSNYGMMPTYFIFAADRTVLQRCGGR